MNRCTTSLLIVTIVSVAASVGCQSFTKSDSGTVKPPVESSARFSHEVEVVRNGVLGEYKSTTVGKAFDGTFQSPTWNSFETPKGQHVVEFTGTMKYGVLASAGILPKIPNETNFKGLPEDAKGKFKACDESTSNSYTSQAYFSCLKNTMGLDVDEAIMPVKFQFFLSNDQETFEMGYVECGVSNQPSDLARVLDFIYH